MQIESGAGSTTGGYVPTYYRDNTYGNHPVTAVLDPVMDGVTVCLSARNEIGRRCGTIGDADYTGGSYAGGLRIDWDTGGVEVAFGGDSGGPITRRSYPYIAVGTHTGHLISGANLYDGLGYAIADAPGFLAGWEILLAPDTKRGRVENFVASRVFRAGLQRFPTVNDMNWWSTQIDNSNNCLATAQWVLRHTFFTEVAGQLPINTSSSATNSANKKKRLYRLYWAAFNRAGDTGGIDWWHGQINSQADWEWAVDTFLANSEAINAIGTLRGQEEGPC